ncbi:hypothetical protein [Trebonia sp.]|uniref:hypothetical protein n=1 Tax=Trebonia sp. TaxID=2767075 RepID=UPI00261A8F53|nr:hypothetical protein [Trebonia sp.]
MRIEAGAPDELVLVLDVAEISGLLQREVSRGALRAALPGEAGALADAVMDIAGEPRPPEPRTIRSVTIKVIETRVIASETLLLAAERQVYA